MKALIQRVSRADVSVDGESAGRIGDGLLVLLGVGRKDTEKQADLLVQKIVNLRIFEDDNAKMNRSLADIQGELLVVSQFTLMADTKKGRRPSFVNAAPPEQADRLYMVFVEKAREKGIKTETGSFGAMMEVSLVNDGPVTIMLDTEQW
jgi:D-tyrosyl-tRNA(Tyr) deacylase